MKEMQVETRDRTPEHASGKDFWDWLVWSNPLVEPVLGGVLALAEDERWAVQQDLGEAHVRVRRWRSRSQAAGVRALDGRHPPMLDCCASEVRPENRSPTCDVEIAAEPSFKDGNPRSADHPRN